MISLLEIDKGRWARMMLHNPFRLCCKIFPRRVPSFGRCSWWTGQRRCPQLPSPILARMAMSLGSSKVGENWKGFLPPLCLLDQLLQFGWKAFLLLSVHLAGNPKDTNTQSQDRWSVGTLSQSLHPWAPMPAEPSKLLLPLAGGPFFWPYPLLPTPAMAMSGQVGGGGGGEDGEIGKKIEIDFKYATIVEISQVCTAPHGVERAFSLASDLQHRGEHWPLLTKREN